MILDRDLQAAAVRHGIARIERQIEQRVLQLVAIDQHRPDIPGIRDLDVDALLEYGITVSGLNGFG